MQSEKLGLNTVLAWLKYSIQELRWCCNIYALLCSAPSSWCTLLGQTITSGAIRHAEIWLMTLRITGCCPRRGH